MKTKPYLPIIFMCLSLFGLIVSYALMQEYYFGDIFRTAAAELNILSEISVRLCTTESDLLNCEKITKSDFSTFLNIPVSAWGLLYFSNLFFFSIFFFRKKNSYGLFPYAFFLMFLTAGSVVSLLLLAVGLFYVKALCPLCLLSYLPVWLSLILCIACMRPGAASGQPVLKWMVYGAYIFGAVLVSACVAYAGDAYLKNKKAEYQQREARKEMETLVTKFYAQKKNDVEVPEICMLGKASAKNTVLGFTDYLCPHCLKSSAILRELAADPDNDLKVCLLNYPLDSLCNTRVRTRFHKGACRFAKGAVCAWGQKKFDRYLEAAIKAFPYDGSRKTFSKIIADAGLEPDGFERCMAAAATEDELQNQLTLAKKLHVRSTPTLFINNRKYGFKTHKEMIEMILTAERVTMSPRNKPTPDTIMKTAERSHDVPPE